MCFRRNWRCLFAVVERHLPDVHSVRLSRDRRDVKTTVKNIAKRHRRRRKLGVKLDVGDRRH